MTCNAGGRRCEIASISSIVLAGLLTTLVLLHPRPIAAQSQAIVGQVVDSLTGEPLSGATIQVFQDDSRVAGDVSDHRGEFRIADLSGGPFAVAVLRIGYRAVRIEGVEVGPVDASLSVVMSRIALRLDPLVVSDSRTEGTLLSAEASMSTVDLEDIEQKVAFTATDHIKGLPGVDISSKGIIQSTYSVRGARSANSQALRTVTDYRFVSIPSIGFNVPYLIPTTSDDIERIELMRGPGSALYGPEADRGVLHIVTRSPFESQGTRLSAAVGERSMFQGTFRHSRLLSQRVAIKVSAEYVRGNDWEYRDPVEQMSRQKALGTGAAADTLLIGARDFDVARFSGETRLEWRPDLATSVNLTGGLARAVNVIDLTSQVGAVQVRGWTYSFLQGRVERNALSANLFLNMSDAGDTYQLRTGNLLVDRSRAFAGQVKYASDLADRATIQYGVDFQRTIPRTAGTIHGSNESNDGLNEIGAYVHATTRLSPQWTVVTAGRADYHSFLDDVALSPRVSVLFAPTPMHMLRLSYNRAFSPPDPGDLFQDITVQEGDLYDIRAVGRPRGYTFARNCGGLCMRSPFMPLQWEGRADATLLWDQLLDFVQSQDPSVPDLPRPTADEVGTILAVLNTDTGEFDQVAQGPEDIGRNERELTNTVELGYTGVLGRHTRIAVDLYATRISNLVSSPRVQTPTVHLDRDDVARYLTSLGLPSDQAHVLAGSLAIIPVGVISPVEATHPTDILMFTRQGGHTTLYGADLSVESWITDALRVRGFISLVSDDSIPKVNRFTDYLLNGPTTKGAVDVQYTHDPAGLSLGVQVRAVSSFPVVSGVYQGTVQGYEVVDANIRFRLPWAQDLFLDLAAYNLFDNRHVEFLGAPEIGRMVVTRLTARL
jgi:iron complex outermembrane receptor protein